MNFLRRLGIMDTAKASSLLSSRGGRREVEEEEEEEGSVGAGAPTLVRQSKMRHSTRERGEISVDGGGVRGEPSLIPSPPKLRPLPSRGEAERLQGLGRV